jgi:hypothetical protein
MLSSIITAALAEAPDIVVAGQIGEGEDLAAEVRATGAEAVIIETSRRPAAGSFAPLLGLSPILKVLKVVAIDSADGSGFVHELHLCKIPIAEFSCDALLSVLRAPSGLSGACARVP